MSSPAYLIMEHSHIHTCKLFEEKKQASLEATLNFKTLPTIGGAKLLASNLVDKRCKNHRF